MWNRWAGSKAAYGEYLAACRKQGVPIDHAKPVFRKKRKAKTKPQRKPKRPLRDNQQLQMEFLSQWDHFELAAESLYLRARYTQGPHGLHVMVESQACVRLVDWWPCTGTWIARDGSRGTDASGSDVLETAQFQE